MSKLEINIFNVFLFLNLFLCFQNIFFCICKTNVLVEHLSVIMSLNYIVVITSIKYGTL